jgi:hypothetical protein
MAVSPGANFIGAAFATAGGDAVWAKEGGAQATTKEATNRRRSMDIPSWKLRRELLLRKWINLTQRR